MDISEIVSKMDVYNKLVARINLAGLYLDNDDIEMHEREKAIPKLQELVKQSDKILKEFKKHDIQYESSEVLGGFNLEFRKERYKRYNY